MARLRFAPFALAAALLFAACGGSDDGGSGASNTTAEKPSTGAAGATVTLEDLKFKPDTVSIKTGGTVRWTWKENVLHNVHSDDFESPNKSDGVFTHTFDKAGTYEYECTLHSGMSGTVEVE
jgi:plastocyanin